ncbi:hypothetical protein Y886_20210 [Xanthomonas hyacinthi DSM 19077]|nr:hypothetical protein Y886_20210 [Xanthomonas hyacinthi DSM 19077]
MIFVAYRSSGQNRSASAAPAWTTPPRIGSATACSTAPSCWATAARLAAHLARPDGDGDGLLGLASRRIAVAPTQTVEVALPARGGCVLQFD